MQQQNHHPHKKKAIGVAGAIIGAGVALAAAKVLSDKKNRKKIMDTLSDVKDKVMDGIETLQDETKGVTKKTQKKIIAKPAKRKTIQKKSLDRPRDEHGRFLKKEETNPNPSIPS